jgi:hypothetical protein
MAVDAERIKAVASWGFLGSSGGEAVPQIIEGPVEITLGADEITVEIDEG